MNKLFLLLLVLIAFCSADVFAQVSVVNQKGTRIDVDSSKWTLSGSNIFNKNAGNVGLGNSSPTYKLDVTGKVRISDSLLANTARILTLTSGTTNDSILVVDPVTGLIKRISASQLNKVDSTTADNGLTLTGKKVQLGGPLTGATSITTTAINTLAVAGLQSGTTGDSLVVANASTGILKRISASQLNKLDSTTASNGLTLLGKDVQLGGSLSGATSITTTATNTLSVAGLQSGTTNDSLVVANASTGALKRISASQLNKVDSTTADNGLTLTGKKVQLGGPLTGATSITTTATNTLAVAGLQSGTTGDSLVVANASTGILKRISASQLNKLDSTTASNGLTLSGKDVQLGGSLSGATSITTTATNTLAVAGLQSGTTNDSLVVANASTGALKRISASQLNKLDSTTASNGLTLSGKDVQLGGSLTGATSITTTATNTLAVAGLQSGTTGDSLVVANASTGVLKRISASQLNKVDSTTADNGLTLTGKKVQLGGPLTGATSITTTATNTLAVAGLQSGTTGDSLVVANASTGILKRISASQLNKLDSTTASNGLTLLGKDVQLGGSLTGATSLTTTGTNTLAVAGLQSGTTGDSLVVANASTGILKRISASQLNKVDSTTASNGLTLTGKDVRLGGSLTGATTIAQAANTLAFTTTAVNGFSVGGTTFSVDGTNSRIGIGTAAPSTQLHTTGTLRFAGLTTNTVNTNIMTTDGTGIVTTRALSSLLGTAWQQGGNSFAALGVLGTNDNNSLSLRTASTQRVLIDTKGNILTGTGNTITGASSVFNYITGNNISSTLNGNHIYAFGDTGIAGAKYLMSFGKSNADFSVLQNGFALADGNDADVNTYLALGNGDDSYINSQGGNLGVGTSTPDEILDVAGNISLSGALKPGGDPGIAGQVLLSNGGATNSWGSAVTNIATGTGLTGGPITSTGTISLANTAVSAGSYGSASNVPTYTVDAQGRLTASANTAIQIAESQVTNLVADLAKKQDTTLAKGKIWIGSATNKATAVTPSGDVTMSVTGVDSVMGFRGVPISAIAPTSGQVLQYSTSGGGIWVPATVSSGGGGTVTSVNVGSLSPLFATTNVGTATSPAFSFAFNNASANTIFGNNTGAAATPSYFAATALPITGDVTGTLGAATVAKLQGRNVNSAAPTAGQVLAWNNTTSVWEPTTNAAATNIYNADGTLTGTRTMTMGTNTLGFTSTATTQSPVSITANSLTTGTGLSILSANTGLNSTSGFLRVFNNAVPTTTTGLFARLQPNSTASSGLTILNNGNTGIGTISPAQPLEISSGVANTSGVRLTNLTSTSPISAGTAIGVNTTGDIVTINSPVTTIYTLASAFSSSTTTRATVTGLSFTVTAGKTYQVEFVGNYQTAAVGTGGSLGFVLPTGVGTIQGYIDGEINSAASATGLRITLRAINATSTTAGSFLTTSGATPVGVPVYIGARFVFICTTSGTLQAQWCSEVLASASQLNTGATMIVTEF